MSKTLRVLAVFAFCLPSLFAVTIAEKTASMEKAAGYFTYYWDAKAGKVWLEIDRWDTEFLYVNSLIAASRCE